MRTRRRDCKRKLRKTKIYRGGENCGKKLNDCIIKCKSERNACDRKSPQKLSTKDQKRLWRAYEEQHTKSKSQEVSEKNMKWNPRGGSKKKKRRTRKKRKKRNKY